MGNRLHCIFFNPPLKGEFTIRKDYTCKLTEKGILVYDDNMQPVNFESSESKQYFDLYMEHHDITIDEAPDDSIFIVLGGKKPNIREIRAYSYICKVSYTAAQKALADKENFLAKGNYYAIEKICQILDEYGVQYIIKPGHLDTDTSSL